MNQETTRKDYDLANESLVVGSFYKQPDLYIEYGTSIKSKYDFADPTCKFLFDCFDIYYTTFSQEIDEDKVNMFMSKDEERKKEYKKLGGWKLISKICQLSSEEDFPNYYDTLKKYSLIRELGRKGFPVARLLDHPKFDKLKAEQVVMSMRTSLDKVHTIIGGGKDSTILGGDMVTAITKWKEIPDMGIEMPFKSWNDLFRGWRKKKLIIDGMLSNEGKSRRMIYVATFISMLFGKKVLVMANEMDEDDMKAAMITTVCNNPEFGFSYNIPERNIVLGEYSSDDEYEKVMEVARYIEKHTKLYFQEMDDYSDTGIENCTRKHVLGLGVEYIFYDTLKSHNSESWEGLKQTTTKIRDLVKELNVGGYATIQLTDDSHYVDVFDFSSNNIANAKQLKHVVDSMWLSKRIPKADYNKYAYLDGDEQWSAETGNEMALDKKYVYYLSKLDKNRAGAKGMVMCTRVDLDLNTWEEMGLAIRKEVSVQQKPKQRR